ncbi:MAG: hypothetical protein IT173_10955 [Acidobacteria bacterium]|nr:hypothetical protein [Acidobacteriota bacterium]
MAARSDGGDGFGRNFLSVPGFFASQTISLQPDGKAVVAGSVQTPSGQFAVVRYNP